MNEQSDQSMIDNKQQPEVQVTTKGLGSFMGLFKDIFKKKWVRYFMIGMGGFIVLIVILAVIIKLQQGPATSKEVDKKTPEPAQIIREEVPSIYANDPEIQAINDRLKEVESALKDYQVSDSDLNPPDIDLNIGFK